MSELAYERVQSALARLKLSEIAAQLDRIAEQAAREQWTYLAFLERLLEARRKKSRSSSISANFS